MFGSNWTSEEPPPILDDTRYNRKPKLSFAVSNGRKNSD